MPTRKLRLFLLDPQKRSTTTRFHLVQPSPEKAFQMPTRKLQLFLLDPQKPSTTTRSHLVHASPRKASKKQFIWICQLCPSTAPPAAANSNRLQSAPSVANQFTTPKRSWPSAGSGTRTALSVDPAARSWRPASWSTPPNPLAKRVTPK